jgi:hypothetical protein
LGFVVVGAPSAISRAEALAIAKRALALANIDAASGQLAVLTSIQGQVWTMTLSRDINGYPVANHWAATGLVGDRVWVTLNGVGGLVELYAVRPPSSGSVATLPLPQLANGLAIVSGLTLAELAALDPGLIWLRPVDEAGVEASTLSLNYCVTRTDPSGWESWCIDAASGDRSAHGAGAD